jgi:hypothetical protein
MTGNPSSNNDNSDDMLKTLTSDGEPPKTRIGDGNQAYQIWQRLWAADGTRSQRRTLVKGLIDGNPPYNPADLADAGQSYRCNVNFGQARAYLENASGAFYDLFKEAPTYATVQINKGTPEQQHQYSQSVTKNFDWLMRYEPRFDYNMQVSQNETVTYAIGPLVFNDELDWVPRAVLAGSLKVPEFTKSDTNYWELCTVEVDYTADELWRKIIDEKSATAAGWDVEAVKQAIMFAQPEFNQGGQYRQWEWYQQQLKNGSLAYAQTSKMICVVQIFFQEFTKEGNKAGKISQVIINRDQAAQENSDNFLYQKLNRYDSWNQCVHPMYYDRGGGGFHHSVTGLGVKMYPALTFINRLRCANADKAFAPKILLEASSATATDEAALEQLGDYLLVNEGFKVAQLPIQSQLEDGMVFDRFIGQELNSNLSQYRSQTLREDGNPPTATQVQFDASNEARLNKTTMVRYYSQLDALYSEMYRRAVEMGKKKVGFGWERCAEFVRRCEADGTPADCLEHTEKVNAYRVIGQGSEFLRQQSLEFLFASVLPMLPENGRFNMIQDIIASRAGQSAVSRYAPEPENKLADNQVAWAFQQVSQMKTGVPAIVTDDQNPKTFCEVFIMAATQAVQSLEQGGNPAEVVTFLDLVGQAIAQQMARMVSDPTRKQFVKEVNAKLTEIGKIHDDLVKGLQEQQAMQAQEQERLMQAQQQQISDQALKAQAQQAKLNLAAQKTQAQMRTKAATTAQSLSLRDAETAQSMALAQAAAMQDLENSKRESEAKAQSAKNKPQK